MTQNATQTPAETEYLRRAVERLRQHSVLPRERFMESPYIHEGERHGKLFNHKQYEEDKAAVVAAYLVSPPRWRTEDKITLKLDDREGYSRGYYWYRAPRPVPLAGYEAAVGVYEKLVNELRERIHQLELENARLKNDNMFLEQVSKSGVQYAIMDPVVGFHMESADVDG